MIIFTKDILQKLIKNHQATAKAIAEGTEQPNHKPVLKVFNPYGAATWLLTEYNPETDELFGLADLGMGSPELGYVLKQELLDLRVGPGKQLKLERDMWFTAEHTLTEYADKAREEGSIRA